MNNDTETTDAGMNARDLAWKAAKRAAKRIKKNGGCDSAAHGAAIKAVRAHIPDPAFNASAYAWEAFKAVR